VTTAEGKLIRAEILDTFLWGADDILGPALIQILLDLEPAPSGEELINSLKRTMAQAPLLSRRMERGVFRDRWVTVSGLDPESLLEVVNLPGDSFADGFEDRAHAAFAERAAEKIDLRKEPPIKLLLIRQGSRGLLVLRFHHALADGNGCLQLARLLGENLSQRADSPPPPPIPMNRSFFQIFRSFGLSDLPGIIHETAREALRPPTMLFIKPLIEEDAEESGPLKSSLARLVIEKDEYRTLHNIAREHGLTMNDVVAAALLGLAAEYNSRLPSPSTRLSVTFTADLRRFLKDPGVQITNLSGFSILVSPAKVAENFPAAAAEVREKAGELKRRYLGLGSVIVPNLITCLMPSRIMHAFFHSYGGFVLRQIASHSLFMTNIGAMDSYLAPFGDSLKHASAIATIFNFPVPLLTVTGCRDRLTIYFGQMYQGEDKAGQCQTMADRLRYFLLEWCSK
jgi:NRPS condensation-like uncharacterized protein